MAGARSNAHSGRTAGHSLCLLESCEEGELCPHAVHVAQRMEDGIGGDALNVRRECHQRIEWYGNTQQRAENPLTAREGVPDDGKLLGVLSTKLAPGGEENSGDPTMIGYNHSSCKINQLHQCRTLAQGLWDPMGSSLPRAGALVK